VKSKTKPRIPKSVQVGACRYSITDNAVEIDAATRELDYSPKDADGLTDHGLCRIFIEPDQHISQKQDTTLHEVLHCVWRISDWTTKVPKDDPEEYIIKRMTAGLLDTMQRNPKLIAYLLYKGK